MRHSAVTGPEVHHAWKFQLMAHNAEKTFLFIKKINKLSSDLLVFMFCSDRADPGGCHSISIPQGAPCLPPSAPLQILVYWTKGWRVSALSLYLYFCLCFSVFRNTEEIWSFLTEVACVSWKYQHTTPSNTCHLWNVYHIFKSFVTILKPIKMDQFR